MADTERLMLYKEGVDIDRSDEELKEEAMKDLASEGIEFENLGEIEKGWFWIKVPITWSFSMEKQTFFKVEFDKIN